MSRHEARASGRSTAAVVAAALALAGCAGAPAANAPTSGPSAAAALTPAPTTAATSNLTGTPPSLPADYCPGGSYVPSPAESTALASGSVVREIPIGTDAFDVAFADGSIW